MEIILTLGCWGSKSGDFCLCSGIENEILNLTKNTDLNKDICDYLDKNFKIFDRPLYNNVHTAIWNIQEKFSNSNKNIFDDNYFKLLENFCVLHAKCGLYIRLIIK